MGSGAGRAVEATDWFSATVHHKQGVRRAYSMVSEWCLTSSNSASCVHPAQGQEQEDAEQNGCKDGPFDHFCCIRVPPVAVVVVIIIIRIAISLSLSQVDHVCRTQGPGETNWCAGCRQQRGCRCRSVGASANLRP